MMNKDEFAQLLRMHRVPRKKIATLTEADVQRIDDYLDAVLHRAATALVLHAEITGNLQCTEEELIRFILPLIW